MAARLATLVVGALSFVSLVLAAIAMATNYWVTFDDRSPGPRPSQNPLETNSAFSGLLLEYDLDYFGLWVGCHLLELDQVRFFALSPASIHPKHTFAC